MENREVFFYSRTFFWGFGLSLIFNITGTSFWISELIGMVVGFLILAMIKRVRPHKTVKMVTGFMIALLACGILVNLGGTLYLRNTPNLLLGIVPLIAAFVMSLNKKKAMKKTLFVLFLYSMFMTITAAGILSQYSHVDNVLPLTPNAFDIIKGAVIFVLTSVTPVICMNDFEDRKSLLLNYALSMICILGISLLTMFVLGSKEAMMYRSPEYGVLKRIKIYEFFNYVDNIYFVIMIVDLIVMMAYGLKNMDLAGKIKPTICILAICGIVSFVCTHTYIITFFYAYFPVLLFILLIATLFPKK